MTRGTTLPFPDLKPEITKSYEASLEAKFLNDRLGFVATVYKSNSSNQLLKLALPSATGYAFKYLNAGNIQNKGLELMINATPVKSRDLSWDISLNLGLNRNKVIALSPDIKVAYLAGGFGRSATPQVAEGGSYGDLVGFQWAKNANGQYLVHTASTMAYSGLPITTDKAGQQQSYLGNFMPKETLGMTNTIRYKNFTARILIDGRIGGIIVDGTEMNLAFSGIPDITSKYREGGLNLNGVDSSGKAVNVPLTAQQFWQAASYQRYGVAQFFTYSATNFRLRELTIGYDLPVKSTVIKTARISFIARNLLWLYRGSSILDIPGLGKRKMTFDPDMSLGNDNYQGISYGTLPATRSYGLNLQLTF